MADGVVERRVAVLVSQRHAGRVGDEQLDGLELALARGDMERGPAVGVRLVHVEPDPQEPLHLLQLPSRRSPAERGDMLRLPPLVEECHLLLDVGEDDRIEVVVVLRRLLVVCWQADLILLRLVLLRLILLRLVLVRPEACIAPRIAACSGCTPRMLRELKLPQRVLRDDLLVVRVRLEHGHDLRSNQPQADRARATAGASSVDVANSEEEGEIADASARPDGLVVDRDAVGVLDDLIDEADDHKVHLVRDHVRLEQKLLRTEVDLPQQPLDVGLELGAAALEEHDVVEALARHGRRHLEPQGVRDRVKDLRRADEVASSRRPLEVAANL
mmetsp:Transcript_1847/g.4035  ORF Transcript_1847/g.4035 Transcript_1847/m.4035 type:complete len:330 (-) Transcript_1847:6127-7116(-)